MCCDRREQGTAKRQSWQGTINAKADGWSSEEEIGGEESPIGWRKSNNPGKADWWLSDWKNNWRSTATSSWEVSISTRLWWSSKADKGRQDRSWQDARWEKPAWSSENRQNILDKVVREFGGWRVHTKQSQCLKEHISCDGDLCAGTDKVLKSIEHICYDCWAVEEGIPTREGFLQAQKGTIKRRYVCHWDSSHCDNNAWEFVIGAFVNALGMLEEQRAIWPEGRRAERPWNRNFDENKERKEVKSSLVALSTPTCSSQSRPSSATKSTNIAMIWAPPAPCQPKSGICCTCSLSFWAVASQDSELTWRKEISDKAEFQATTERSRKTRPQQLLHGLVCLTSDRR